MNKLILMALALLIMSCQKEEMNECIDWFQYTITDSKGNSYIYKDVDGTLQYGDVTEDGVVTERLPFNTCIEEQPYL